MDMLKRQKKDETKLELNRTQTHITTYLRKPPGLCPLMRLKAYERPTRGYYSPLQRY